MTPDQASALAGVFKALASDTRLRLLHVLARAGEACVSDLAAATAMTTQAVSNQLQRLAERGVLTSRRDGTHIHYRITDPCVTGLLDLAWCVTEDAEDATW